MVQALHELNSRIATLIARDASLSGALNRMARRYVWWMAPDEALREHPARLIAQVMDIGTFEDIVALEELLGRGILRDVIAHAQPGWLRPRSWNFWHYRLGITEPGDEPPPPPERRFALS